MLFRKEDILEMLRRAIEVSTGEKVILKQIKLRFASTVGEGIVRVGNEEKGVSFSFCDVDIFRFTIRGVEIEYAVFVGKLNLIVVDSLGLRWEGSSATVRSKKPLPKVT